jgi:hypothetical protein
MSNETVAFLNRVAGGAGSGQALEDDYVPVALALPVTPFSDPATAGDLESIQLGEVALIGIGGVNAPEIVSAMIKSIT